MEIVKEIGNYQAKYDGLEVSLKLDYIERNVEPFTCVFKSYRANFTFSKDNGVPSLCEGPSVVISYYEDDRAKIFNKVSGAEKGIEAIFLDKKDPNLSQETQRRVLRCINLLEEDFKNKGI